MFNRTVIELQSVFFISKMSFFLAVGSLSIAIYVNYTAPKPVAKIDIKEIPSIPDAIEMEEEERDISLSNHLESDQSVEYL